MSKEIILLRGIPGAGKSTLAGVISKGDPSIIVSADMFFEDEDGNYKFNARDLPYAHKWSRNQVEFMMNDEYPLIIVANTFVMEWEFKEYYELASKYGYRVHSVICENRHGSKSIHDVPADKIEIMRGNFQVKI